VLVFVAIYRLRLWKLLSIPCSDGQGNDDRFGAEPIFDLIESAVKVGSFSIHFVDEGDSWNVIFIRLPPDGFALGFDSFSGREDNDSAVEYAQGAFDFGCEVDVTGRVDEVERMFLPIEGNACGLDGDSSFLFFGIVIGNGGALIDHSDFVYEVGVEEHSFGNGGFSCVDVGDDADVSDVLQCA